MLEESAYEVRYVGKKEPSAAQIYNGALAQEIALIVKRICEKTVKV